MVTTGRTDMKKLIVFFYLRLLVTTHASPSSYNTGYLQRLLHLIPITNLPLHY